MYGVYRTLKGSEGEISEIKNITVEIWPPEIKEIKLILESFKH